MASPARFHAPEVGAAGEQATLRGEEHHHLSRVLRLKPGDSLSLFDGRGRGFSARLVSVGRHESIVSVIGEETADEESPLSLSLAVALSKGEKLDWVLQKGTELGVQAFHPIPARRSDLRIPAERVGERLARWRRVVLEACKQSGRTRLPEVHAPEPLASFLARPLPPLRIVLEPGSEAGWKSLGTDPALKAGKDPGEDPGRQQAQGAAVVATGPEGGWEPEEIAAFRAARFVTLRLGPRTLRCETAAIAAAALLQHLAGDLR